MKTSNYREHSTLTLRMWEFTGTAIVNLFVILLALAYLFPLTYMAVTSVKLRDQFLKADAPLYPAEQLNVEYAGKTRFVYAVPMPDGTVKDLALVKPSRTSAEFVDPNNIEAGIIQWEGNWRSLKGVYRFHLTFQNFTTFFEQVKIPLLVWNTLIVAFWGEVGVLMSSIAVAYGFSRFRIPGEKYLFLILVATILIPDVVTLIPTYIMYVRVLDWNGTWLPLIVPHFFGNAIFIFLLRQNFKSIPRELDEAAMIDGAGPLRILISIIIPQSIPAITTVALLHFFYAWNELRAASLYLGIAPNLRTVSFSVQTAQTIMFTPEMLQVGAIVAMSVPVVLLFLAQRFFMEDMVVTGLEK
jgi:multiple sugar transport system permease protein